jgi:CBS domain containing-hemolysin-like protein
VTELLFLVGVAVLVAANGFFVASEFALVRARQTRLEQMRDEGKAGASLALAQVDRIDEYLSACQLGITMASLGIGFLGEPAIASLLEDPLGGVVSHGVAVAIAIAVAYLITTSLLDLPRGGHRAPRRTPPVSLPRGLQAVHLAAQHGVQLDAAADRRGPAQR